MKVVINTCFGGFGLSNEALAEAQLAGLPVEDVGPPTGDSLDNAFRRVTGLGNLRLRVEGGDAQPSFRADPRLVEIVERLGTEANGRFAKLKVVEIPDSVDFEIDDYDGMESIHEVHRSWS